MLVESGFTRIVVSRCCTASACSWVLRHISLSALLAKYANSVDVRCLNIDAPAHVVCFRHNKKQAVRFPVLILVAVATLSRYMALSMVRGCPALDADDGN